MNWMAGATAADTIAEQITLPRVDSASASPQPTTVGTLWVGKEYDELTQEQQQLHAAAGEEEAREATVEAAGLAPAATAEQRLLTAHQKVIDTVTAMYVTVLTHLSPHRRRPPKAKRWHLLAKTAFLAGDIAGISTAAIWLGEIPAIAIVMAVSAAAATVTAGISGAEVRDVRDRIRRAPLAADLPDTLAPYRHLFTAPDQDQPYLKALLWVSAAVAGTIACAIFGLRSSIEDPLVGLVFGGIAAAIACASWIESFCHADAVAGLIDNAEADHNRETARHRQLAASPQLRRHGEAQSTATSIQAEHAHRATAAAHHMQALLHGIHRRNPHTAGDGPAPEATTIGQTTRRGATK